MGPDSNDQRSMSSRDRLDDGRSPFARMGASPCFAFWSRITNMGMSAVITALVGTLLGAVGAEYRLVQQTHDSVIAMGVEMQGIERAQTRADRDVEKLDGGARSQFASVWSTLTNHETRISHLETVTEGHTR